MTIQFNRILKHDLYIAILFMILGAITYFIFGLEGGRYPPRGAILRFEGFSYFFPTGIPLIIILVILFLRFFILSYTCEIEIQRSEEAIESISLKITQIIPIIKRHYCLNINQIESIQIAPLSQRGYYLFFVIMGLYFDFTLKNGTGNLFLPNIQGVPITGLILLFSGSIALVSCLYLLTQCNNVRISFITKNVDYFLDIPLKLFLKQRAEICKFLEEIPCSNKHQIVNQSLTFSSINNPKQKQWIFIIAITFILSGFLNIFLIQYSFIILGDGISWLLFYFGIFLIMELMNEHTSKASNPFEKWSKQVKKTRYLLNVSYLIIGWSLLVSIRLIISLLADYSIGRIILSLLVHVGLTLIILFLQRKIFKN